MSDEQRGRRASERVAALEAAVAARTRDLQAALDQRSTLLNELDHRVKNNLQLISSLMLMQARRADDPAVKRALMAMQERLAAIAVVHRRLFQAEDVGRFDLAEFVRDLVAEVGAPLASQDVEIVCDLAPASAPAAKAASLALLINELVSRAVHEALPAGAGGRLSISIAKSGADLGIEILAAGVGVGQGGEAHGDGEDAFGLTIVDLLGRQLQARIERERVPDGVRLSARLPLESDTDVRR